MPERWFVIAHEASNSGAPRMLLRILQSIRAQRPGWSCEIVLRYGGPLLDAFAELGPIHVLAHRWAHGRSARARSFRRLIDRPWLQPRRYARVLEGRPTPHRFDVTYSNTATNGFLVAEARRLGCPVITHVHELADSLHRFNTPAELAATLDNSDHFLAVSPPASEDLQACGVPAERITVVANFLTALPPAADAARREAARRALNLPPDARIVVGCGHIDRVKGTDRFVEMAALLQRRDHLRTQFVWLGDVIDVRFARELRAEVRRRGLEADVRFAGQVPDANPWFTAADLVVVTSRAESFSLVALEAAALGCPVAGFAGTRGLGFVLGDEPALLAPGFDVAALAARAERLLAAPAEARRLGSALRTRVGELFLAPRQVEKILAVADAVRASRRELR